MNKTYDVFLEPHARRELDKIPSDVLSKIDKAILKLPKNPRPFGVKKLGDHLYRIRIRQWRIVYAIFDKEARVVILRVVRRGEKTYKNLN